MFYENPSVRPLPTPGAKLESALVVLTPAESKRLIAKAVAILPEVQAALTKGWVVIAWGSTNTFVVEEITGKTIAYKTDFASGVISEGELNATSADIKINPFVFQNGKPSEVHQKEALRNFMPGDVVIKGANAVDAKGDIGIFVADSGGGFINNVWFPIAGRGGTFICPIGLEKLVPSVSATAEKCNLYRFKYSMGSPCAFMTFPNARVVTEIQALQVLAGVQATHIASGGIGGSEGAVVLVIEGEAASLEHAFEIVKKIKGEKPLPPPRKLTNPRAETVNYDPSKLSTH